MSGDFVFKWWWWFDDEEDEVLLFDAAVEPPIVVVVVVAEEEEAVLTANETSNCFLAGLLDTFIVSTWIKIIIYI